MAAITACQPATWDEDVLADLHSVPAGAAEGTAISSYNPTPGERHQLRCSHEWLLQRHPACPGASALQGEVFDRKLPLDASHKEFRCAGAA